jgi:flagellar hook-basal body complex protein FliE
MGPIAPVQVAIRPIEPPDVQPAAGGDFAQTLRDTLAGVVKGQQAAESAAEAFATGRTGDIASTMLTVEQASLTLQFLLQVRTRLIEAYQEIQRLQV